MRWFGKRKETCCAGAAETRTRQETAGPAPGVQVLGSGCAKCAALEASVREALAELGMDPAVGHVTDFAQIAACGVMTTPALMVDGRVVSCGRVLSPGEARELIRKVRG